MAAIVRIKRRADEEPSNGIVINCKRPKTNSDTETIENTLLQFVTTLEEPTNDVLNHINKRNTKQELEREYKKHFTNIAYKIKEQRESDVKNSRFKLISTFRSKGSMPDDPEKNSEINYTVLEVDTTQETENSGQVSDSVPVKYVYDLYYTNSDDFSDDAIDYQDIDIHPLNFDLVNESSISDVMNDEDSADSEDSNAENNWRNDYPDEIDDADSITEQDMLNAMQRVTIEDELSSDEGEAGFVYSIDSAAAGFEEGIDDTDVQRYGERYARFKARHRKTDNSDDDSDNATHDLCDATLEDDEHYY